MTVSAGEIVVDVCQLWQKFIRQSYRQAVTIRCGAFVHIVVVLRWDQPVRCYDVCGAMAGVYDGETDAARCGDQARSRGAAARRMHEDGGIPGWYYAGIAVKDIRDIVILVPDPGLSPSVSEQIGDDDGHAARRHYSGDSGTEELPGLLLLATWSAIDLWRKSPSRNHLALIIGDIVDMLKLAVIIEAPANVKINRTMRKSGGLASPASNRKCAQTVDNAFVIDTIAESDGMPVKPRGELPVRQLNKATRMNSVCAGTMSPLNNENSLLEQISFLRVIIAPSVTQRQSRHSRSSATIRRPVNLTVCYLSLHHETPHRNATCNTCCCSPFGRHA